MLGVSLGELNAGNLGIGLSLGEDENEFTFRVAVITMDRAREMILAAREAGSLICLSNDDLNAPWNPDAPKQREDVEGVCRHLKESLSIDLHLEDFLGRSDEQEEQEDDPSTIEENSLDTSEPNAGESNEDSEADSGDLYYCQDLGTFEITGDDRLLVISYLYDFDVQSIAASLKLPLAADSFTFTLIERCRETSRRV